MIDLEKIHELESDRSNLLDQRNQMQTGLPILTLNGAIDSKATQKRIVEINTRVREIEIEIQKIRGMA